jgi:hypothetical protein
MYPTEFKGGGFKKIISIVAQIAIPMVAPGISMSMGLSGAIGKTLGSALTGAVLGGVASAATGGDWKKGALMGGLSGGVAGYMSSPTAGMTGPGFDAPVADPLLAPTSAPIAGQYPMTAAQAGYTGPAVPTATGPYVNTSFEDALSGSGGGDYSGLNADGSIDTSGYGGQDYSSKLGEVAAQTQGQQVATQPVGMKPSVVEPPADTSWGGKFKAGMKNAFSPDKLGDAAVRGLGNLLVNEAVGTSYSPEQQQLIDSRQAEVERLEAQGAEVDAIKLAEAKKLLRLAMNVDPTYLGRQAANLAKNQAGRATGEAVRRVGAGGNQQQLADAVRRRGGLTTGKFAASAFDRGYQGGLKEKLGLQKEGVGMLPDSKNLAAYYTSLGTQYNNGAEARDKERAAYNALFNSALS